MKKKTCIFIMLLALVGPGEVFLSGCAKQSKSAGPKTVSTAETEQTKNDQEKMVEEQQDESMAETEVESLKTFEKKVEEEEESPTAKKAEKQNKK